jgi:hypothetical protein
MNDHHESNQRTYYSERAYGCLSTPKPSNYITPVSSREPTVMPLPREKVANNCDCVDREAQERVKQDVEIELKATPDADRGRIERELRKRDTPPLYVLV